MKYLGGKTLIVPWVREHVLSRVSEPLSCVYVEPFVGSATVWTAMAPLFASAAGYDGHPDLVLLHRALRDGWRPPRVTRETYDEYRWAEPSALRGYLGFFCGFGGIWYRCFAGDLPRWDERELENMWVTARLTAALRRCPPVEHRDYRDVVVGGRDVVYADPPYSGTESYGGVSFDSYRFWAIAAGWVRSGALVVVSESRAPGNWVCVAERTRIGLLAYRSNGGGRFSPVRHERLFVHESQAMASERHAHAVAMSEGRRAWPAIE